MSNRICIALFLIFLLGSCGVKKFIPEDRKLYTGAEMELNAELPKREVGQLQDELEGLLRPQPNSKVLGVRFGLWAHYKGSKENPGFINRFLKNRFGESPVYLSDVQPDRTLDILGNRMENKGYFFYEMDYEVKEKDKFASIKYGVEFTEAYKLEKYNVLGDSLDIIQEIIKDLDETELKEGTRFDLEKLKSERERIDKALKAKGYYNFNSDLLIFESDTNQYDSRKYDLYLRLKNEVPEKSLHPYSIQQIRVYPNYSVTADRDNQDTVRVGGIKVIQEEIIFRPDLLENYILFEPNQKFNPQTSRLTSNRLSSIGNFRYVNISYEEGEERIADGTYPLDARILLSPLDKRGLRAEIQGVTKSNSFVGPALILNYQNRNLFLGGETFNLTGKIGYEQQIASGSREALRSIELGLTGSLIFPRVLFPVPIMNRFNFSIPKTKISLGYEYQNRTDLYQLNSYKATFGYLWNVNRYQYHEFNPISLSIVDLANTTPAFEEILNSNPFLRRSFEQQFISGMNYTWNYNQLVDVERKNAIVVTSTIDLAGNLFKGLNRMVGSENPDFIFGLDYAQFIKGEVDLVFYHKFTKEHQLVSRIFGGMGVPLGNSSSLPFVKQFFAGGPRSVRAFRIRALGPGTFVPQSIGAGGFFDQAGDIRLEGNLEYRFPFNRYLKGAFFVDAGNVWLYNENEALPGGRFTSQWMEELAVGAGFGLRIDIQLFVLRFDLAVPVRKPWLEPENRWQDRLEFGSGDWRRENMVLNFAIGYPF
ncbi:BamA/TamA family outer membrane protein [Mongoliibacter ruber]|uniref:Outer membrane protein assembly factor BamA n=1 Tax=Mongoliibacter ruber TaxID=1750599 RepID=A0A2T0WKC1_9BACT|nr:BamA/TamA family outer membrane protein [Mongoliibacter ruber]PRY87159.1 outer membrane protein assembly factor BamA [Mongoliibacter ruber]